MSLDVNLLPQTAAVFLVMFLRLGTMVMLLPGIGERSVPARFRLVIALLLTLTLFPLHQNAYPANLTSLPVLLLVGASEFLIGVVLGLIARLSMSAMQVAGTVVATQLGLAFAMQFDPAAGQQGVVVSNFLTVLALTLIFATDLHHLIIAALDHSYRLFRPAELPPTGDVAKLMVDVVGGAFRIAIQIAAPFLVFGLLFNFGLGLLARLMPQMQVFFVGLPISLMAGFLILIAVLGTMMAAYLTHLRTVAGTLAGQ
jgi:flagellar biosynthetic protein FliR